MYISSDHYCVFQAIAENMRLHYHSLRSLEEKKLFFSVLAGDLGVDHNRVVDRAQQLIGVHSQVGFWQVSRHYYLPYIFLTPLPPLSLPKAPSCHLPLVLVYLPHTLCSHSPLLLHPSTHLIQLSLVLISYDFPLHTTFLQYNFPSYSPQHHFPSY